jgi:hypothetical protein
MCGGSTARARSLKSFSFVDHVVAESAVVSGAASWDA